MPVLPRVVARLSLIKTATYLRGQIVTSYAQVEFLQADVSVKLDLKCPYLIRDRIKAVKQIAESPCYEIYKDELDRVWDDSLQYDEMRNFMAHGFMMLTTDKADNHSFVFRLYQRESSEKFNLITVETTLPRMQAASDLSTRYVTEALQLFGRIYLEKKLDHLQTAL
jgi:hypothetical protein